MATYTKTTDFLAKDSLLTGNPAKKVKGSEIDTEFNNIATADADNVKSSGFCSGVGTFLATPSSANLAAAVTGETGSGALVFGTSPTLVTPALGTPSALTLTNATGLPVATGVSGLGTGVATALAVNVGSAGAPVVLNGALGTPSSGNLANCTGASVVVQVVEATPYTTAGTTAATMLIDSSIPQNTEGLELTTVTITPTSATNRLRISASLPFVDADTIRTIAAALFQDATADAIATSVTSITLAGGNVPTSLSFDHEMAAGTTSATTFKLRVGVSGGTAFINRQASGVTLGGVTAVRLRVEEIKV